MNDAELRTTLLRCLETAVPGADVSSLDPSEDIRDQLDMDSMDVLRFARAIHDALHIDVPDADTGKLVTLDGALAYLASRRA